MKKYLIIVLLLCAVVVLGAWGISMYSENSSLNYALEQKYEADFEEFYEDVEILSDSLKGCTVSMDETYVVNTLSEAAESASSAKQMLSKLPVSQIYASKIQSVLSRGEEFARSVLKSYLSGNSLTDEQRRGVLAVSTACESFLDELDLFYDKLETNESFSWIKNNADYYFSEADDIFGDSMSDMSNRTDDFPDINYDGMYSSHMQSIVYKGISGDEVSHSDISSSLTENMGEGWQVEYLGEGAGDLPTHSFTASDGSNTMYAVFSKTGGNLISASSYNYPEEVNISSDKAEEHADKFISQLNLENMQAEYYDYYNNILSVTYVYMHDGIKCLSDTMTVQVSMQDGKILGYEADSYYRSHFDRDDRLPVISEDEARSRISANLTINGSSLCYLPTDGGEENLCYEFVTELNDDIYLVYIDADSGVQRDIVRVTSGENIFKVK